MTLLLVLMLLVGLVGTYLVGVRKITFRQAVIGIVISDLSILVVWFLVVLLVV